jgi:hypothetical protein
MLGADTVLQTKGSIRRRLNQAIRRLNLPKAGFHAERCRRVVDPGKATWRESPFQRPTISVQCLGQAPEPVKIGTLAPKSVLPGQDRRGMASSACAAPTFARGCRSHALHARHALHLRHARHVLHACPLFRLNSSDTWCEAQRAAVQAPVKLMGQDRRGMARTACAAPTAARQTCAPERPTRHGHKHVWSATGR